MTNDEKTPKDGAPRRTHLTVLRLPESACPRASVRVVSALVFRPVGTHENSPALECWVGPRPKAKVPIGTAERNARLCRPCGTGTVPIACPVLKRWAISGRPCGNEIGAQTAVARSQERTARTLTWFAIRASSFIRHSDFPSLRPEELLKRADGLARGSVAVGKG